MSKHLRRRPPPVVALLLQVAAIPPALAIALVLHSQHYAVTLVSLAFLCGLIAALLSHLFGLAKWWIPIQLLFLPALAWTLSLDLSPTWFLIAFLILLAVYWSTFRTQVPLYLSSEKVWRALVDLLPPATPGKPITFMDLGSGLGGVLAHLSSARPDGRYFGVEVAPLPFFWGWLRLLRKHNCEVRWGSLWDCDLSQYDVVFAYLSPVPMEQLWLKAQKEMRPGSTFISSTFDVPDQRPQQTIQIDDMHRSTLLIWHL
ncbi:MAG: class I SAM-dependent methyltransferase [Gallionellaceae bacterium]|nr:MAG: class I SAM-dependent methyltransferase [Gallionellaceae bacterium]